MKIAGIYFTSHGQEVAARISGAFPETAWTAGSRLPAVLPEGHLRMEGGLSSWAGSRFADCDALLFIGAAGIAVRAIAPWVTDKRTDPAVIVVDERGKFCISLLSGHIGGANALAAEIAEAVGAVPVVTTATDLNGLFAVDEFAARNDLAISDMKLAKAAAASMLAGRTLRFFSDLPAEGEMPRGIRGAGSFARYAEALRGAERAAGAADPAAAGGSEAGVSSASGGEIAGPDAPDIAVGFWKVPDTGKVLRLVPKNVILGIGCRRGTEAEKIGAAAGQVLEEAGVLPEAVCAVATIDIKKDEPGLLEFCRRHGLPLRSFTAEQLAGVPGEYTASAFVADTVGVDNVCERSAVCAGGKLFIRKHSGDGVTCAAACLERTLKF